MVADGMGAHAAGELASKLAVDIVPLAYQKLADRIPPDALRAALEDANAQINGRGRADPDFRGMGTTCTTLVCCRKGPSWVKSATAAPIACAAASSSNSPSTTASSGKCGRLGNLPAARCPNTSPRTSLHARWARRNRSGRHRGAFPADGGRHVPPMQRRAVRPGERRGNGDDSSVPPLGRRGEDADRFGKSSRRARRTSRSSSPRVTGPLPLNKAADQPPRPQQIRRRPIPTGIWIALTALTLLGLGLLVMGYPVFGHDRLGGGRRGCRGGCGVADRRSAGRELGPHAPRTRALCGFPMFPQTPSFPINSPSIAREVRDAATNGGWAVDWAQFNGRMDCGTYTCQASDYVQAVFYYCQAISFIMGELRQQRRAK